VRIVIGDPPRSTRIAVAGVQVGEAVSGFRLGQAPGEFPTLTLDLPVFPAEGRTTVVDCAAARVVMPSATANLLVRVGWTPPGGPPGDLRADPAGTAYLACPACSDPITSAAPGRTLAELLAAGSLHHIRCHATSPQDGADGE
jgi:hypothetical protein